MGALLIRLCIIGGVAYVGVCLSIVFRQSRHVYYPQRALDGSPADFGLAFEEVSLKAGDGTSIHGWYIPSETTASTAVTVLFCHGNGGNISHRLEMASQLRRMGLNVLLFDYRGYGRSEGKPSEEGTYLDAQAAWDYLTQARGMEPSRVVIYGRSLGGAIAAHLAMDTQPGALVLDSAFTSAPDMARRMFRGLPVRLLCRFNYNTLAALKRIKCPVLIAHARPDEVIPYAHGERLFAAAAEPKQFYELTCTHNVGGIESDPRYRQVLAAFIREHL